MTGNTVIDALFLIKQKITADTLLANKLASQFIEIDFSKKWF